MTDLRARDFRVLEDGRPQALTYFSAGGSGPTRLLVIADQSGSMGGRDSAASARMALTQVLAGLGPEDEAALAGFDADYRMIVPFTHERAPLLAALDALVPFGSTALHDALARGARDAATGGEGRRAVLVLTDGLDTASQLTAEEALARAQSLEVPIYAVSIVSPLDDPESPLFAGNPASPAGGRAVLERYAALSGGAAFAVSDFRGLQRAAARILGEVKQQYRLGYDPPPGPPGFRRVEVLSTRKGVVVRARRGYMART